MVRKLRKREVTILLHGQTGAGKTTFLSLLNHYLCQRDLDDLFTTQLSERGPHLSDIFSQTQQAEPRTIHCNETVFHILDTPGLADTGGIKVDKRNQANVMDAIAKSIKSIDAVLLIANGTVTRNEEALKYSLSIFSAMLPHLILRNVGIVYTHVTGGFLNFQSEALPEALRHAEHWSIQNPFALYEKYLDDIAKGISGEELESWREDITLSYRSTTRVLERLFVWLDQTPAQPVSQIIRLHSTSTSIEKEVEETLDWTTECDEIGTRLGISQDAFEKAHKTAEEHENYTSYKTTTTMERESTNKHYMICFASGCHTNCCYDCDSALFDFLCGAFDGSRICSKCGHHSKQHGRFRSRWESKVKTDTMIDYDKKWTHERAKKEQADLQVTLKDIKAELNVLNRKISQKKEMIATLCTRFAELSLSDSFAGRIKVTIDFAKNCLAKMDKGVDAQRELDAFIGYSMREYELLKRLERVTDTSRKTWWSPQPMELKLSKSSMTIILLGEIGVGKKTIASLLFNVLLQKVPSGFNSNDDIFFSERCGQYEIATSGFKLRIIYAPISTSDSSQLQAIAKVIKDSAAFIDGIILLMNGAVNRIGTATEYLVTSILPLSLRDNIGIIYTNVTSGYLNFNHALLPGHLSQAKYWTIDNPFALYISRQIALADGESSQELKRMDRTLAQTYCRTIPTLHDIFSWLDDRDVQPVADILTLCDVSVNIELMLASAFDQANQGRRKYAELQHLKTLIEASEKTEERFSNYTSVSYSKTNVLETTLHLNRACMSPDCFSNCCYDCDARDLGRMCSRIYFWSKNCKGCGHALRDHGRVHSQWRIQEDKEETIHTLQRQQYNYAKRKTGALRKVFDPMERDLNKFTNKLAENEKTIRRFRTKHQRLALSIDFARPIVSAIALLEARAETMKAQMNTTDVMALKKVEEDIYCLRGKQMVLNQCAAGVLAESVKDPSML